MSSQPQPKLAARTAILVRTKDRPAFLLRALESITRQTDQDWCLVILHGGGDRLKLDEVLAPFLASHGRKILVYECGPTDSSSLGNLNYGARLTASTYLAIHDDDDSWEPEFLARTTAELELHPRYGACITKSWKVEEKLEGTQIVFGSKEIYNDWQDQQVSLFRVAESLTFPPIAMLLRRSAYEETGPFRADLPVMGDWEFCLRLLAKFPAGFISEPLASYHHHGGNATRMAELSRKYARVGTEIRNELLRADLAAGRMGLGFLCNMSHAHGHLYAQIWEKKK